MRYPPEARRRLEEAGVRYAGWLPNHRVPEVFGLEICVGLGLEDLHAEAFAAAVPPPVAPPAIGPRRVGEAG